MRTLPALVNTYKGLRLMWMYVFSQNKTGASHKAQVVTKEMLGWIYHTSGTRRRG